ncbi:hypothetical protein ACHAPU_002924 [Fusarium lateritium]
MSDRSNVGNPSIYEDGDQHHYSKEAVNEEHRSHPDVNIDGYINKDSAMSKLQARDTQAQVDDKMKHEPGYAATMHGNQPSRGAQVDMEIARDEAEQLAKKKDKTDSLPGKKLDHNE